MTGRYRATPTGLEPATSAVTGRRANQLRYGALVVPRPNCWVVLMMLVVLLFGAGGQVRPAVLHRSYLYPQRDSNPCYRRERAAS